MILKDLRRCLREVQFIWDNYCPTYDSTPPLGSWLQRLPWRLIRERNIFKWAWACICNRNNRKHFNGVRQHFVSYRLLTDISKHGCFLFHTRFCHRSVFYHLAPTTRIDLMVSAENFEIQNLPTFTNFLIRVLLITPLRLLLVLVYVDYFKIHLCPREMIVFCLLLSSLMALSLSTPFCQAHQDLLALFSVVETWLASPSRKT